jgi:hypothetical protein
MIKSLRIVKLCALGLSLLMSACRADAENHRPVAVDVLTTPPPFLSAKQYAIVAVARRAASPAERRAIMLTVFKGILILYRGDPNAPLGLVKPGTGNCLRGNTAPCRECFPIIGSGSILAYCPQPVDLLPTGSRVFVNRGAYWTRLDNVVRGAGFFATLAVTDINTAD